MALDIHHLIAAIRPDVFCEPAVRTAVRRRLRASVDDGMSMYLCAAEVAHPRECNTGPTRDLLSNDASAKAGLLNPCERHELVVDSLGDAPERGYFLLLNALEDAGWRVTKLGDDLDASSASELGHHLEEGILKGQEHAAKLFRAVQETLPRLLRNLEELRALDEGQETSAPMKGSGPGNRSQDETKRALSAGKAREIRRSLLISTIRSQLSALKVYARWLHPFLGAADPIAGRTSHSSHLVKAFNTAIFRVELIALNDRLLQEELDGGSLPRWLGSKRYRRATPVLIVEMAFRTVPGSDRGGGFHHRGRTHFTFTSYALREDEIRLLHSLIDHQALTLTVRAAGPVDPALLESLERELGLMVSGDKESPSSSDTEDTNPFSALWALVRGWFQSTAETNDADQAMKLPLSPDSYAEEVLRSRALILARNSCREVFFALKNGLELASEGVSR